MKILAMRRLEASRCMERVYEKVALEHKRKRLDTGLDGLPNNAYMPALSLEPKFSLGNPCNRSLQCPTQGTTLTRNRYEIFHAKEVPSVSHIRNDSTNSRKRLNVAVKGIPGITTKTGCPEHAFPSAILAPGLNTLSLASALTHGRASAREREGVAGYTTLQLWDINPVVPESTKKLRRGNEHVKKSPNLSPSATPAIFEAVNRSQISTETDRNSKHALRPIETTSNPFIATGTKRRALEPSVSIAGYSSTQRLANFLENWRNGAAAAAAAFELRDHSSPSRHAVLNAHPDYPLTMMGDDM